jgi:hypothetical protein
VQYDGYGIKTIQLLSETLNFKLRFNPVLPRDIHASSGPLTYFTNNYLHPNLTVDLHWNTESLEWDYYRLTYLVPHSYVSLVNVPSIEYFAVPPGSPYTALDKLVVPFDDGTWALTLITFVLTFGTILIVYRMKVEVQNLVFGENVTTPSLNVLAAFFGISQVVLPRRNFARFLVMSFILLSFMVRNLYQGMMFDYLQRDMRGADLFQSIEAIRSSKVTIFVDYRLHEKASDVEKLVVLFSNNV